MNQFRKIAGKAAGILTAMALLAAFLPGLQTAVRAEGSYTYSYFDPTTYTIETKTVSDVVMVTQDTTEWKDGKWYVVTGQVTVKTPITASGSANLLLCDGASLEAKNGIRVPGLGNLTIWSQSLDEKNMGNLIATGVGGAGIGSRNDFRTGAITINGGKIQATGADQCAGIGGYVYFYGGLVTINGGIVTAEGKGGAAGIGGGWRGNNGTVVINGGTVTATGSSAGTSSGQVGGAGIGGGGSDTRFNGSGGTIQINGGTVTAAGGDRAAGIGGGAHGTGDILMGSIQIGGGMEVYGGASEASDRITDFEGGFPCLKYVRVVPGSQIAVSLDRSSLSLLPGETGKLTATISPADGAVGNKISWSSSDANIAEVSEDGTVTAKHFGTATITVTADNKTTGDTSDDKSQTCTVTVNKPKAVVTAAPVGVNAIYSGKMIPLVSAGSANGGTMRYGVTDISAGEKPEEMSETIPEAQANGRYKVWYYVQGDAEHEDSDVNSVEAVISLSGLMAGADMLSEGYNTETAATVLFGGTAWRVIGAKGGGVAGKDGVLTLLSADVMDATTFGTGTAYAGSTLRSKLNEIADRFSASEKTLIEGRTLDPATDGFAGDSVENALLWPLSSEEADSKNLNNSIRTLVPDGVSKPHWWLRTPSSESAVMTVSTDGADSASSFSSEVNTRPAFYLKPDTVLFTSGAQSGKHSGALGSDALSRVEPNNDQEKKLTLLDSDRNVTFSDYAVTEGGTGISLSYQGACTGENEFISAVIKDKNGSIEYYGRIKHCASEEDSSGQITINLDNKLTEGDTLCLFNEQYHAGKETDYASALQPVALEKVTYNVTFKVEHGSWDDETKGDKTFELTGYVGLIGLDLTLSDIEIPEVGNHPDEGYVDGLWNTETVPKSTTKITEDTVFTYTYSETKLEKKKATVSIVPIGIDMVYSGAYQSPIEEYGESDEGELHYAISDGDSEDVPEVFSDVILYEKDAGTFKIWYYVEGDDNHADSEPACVTATIAPKPITISGITAGDRVYDGWETASLEYDQIDWESIGKVEGDQLYVIADGTFTNVNVGENIPVTISNMRLAGEDASNYEIDMATSQKETTASITPLELQKEDVSITVEPDEMVYTGEPLIPKTVKVRLTDGDADWYEDEDAQDSEEDEDLLLKEGEHYNLSYSNNVNVGTAWVTLVTVPGSNFCFPEGEGAPNMSFSIRPAELQITQPPAARSLIYNGQEQELVTAGKAEGNAGMRYVLGTNNEQAPPDGWDEEIPKAADAGTYYVWYTAVAADEDDNHTGPDSQCVTVVIHEKDTEQEVLFKSNSLVLSGEIGINFFVNLPEGNDVDYSNSYMEFAVSGKNGKVTTDPFDPNDKNETKKYFGFTCYVNSIQMADTVTATFHYKKGGEEKTIGTTYSVEDYLQALQNSDQPDTVKNLAGAIRDFGYYAQTYLSDLRGFSLEVDGDHAPMPQGTAYMEADYQDVLGKVEKYEVIKDPGDSDIEKVTYSLILDSKTGIYLYLQPKAGYDGEVTAVIGEGTENAAVKLSDGRFRVHIPDLSAHMLGETYTVTVTAGTTFEIKVSALSYVQSILDSETAGTDWKNMVTSFYRYYEKAIAYREST